MKKIIVSMCIYLSMLITICIGLLSINLSKSSNNNSFNNVEDKFDIIVVKSYGKACNPNSKENTGYEKIPAQTTNDESGVQPIPNAHSPIIMTLLSSGKSK